MTEAQAYELLASIFKEVFERDDITLTPALTARDVLGWDSFKQVEIIIAIEEAIGAELGSAAVDRLKNVGDLAQLTMQRAPG